MALFKIFKGNSANLPEEKHDGYCYFTTDDGIFYIDYLDADGTTLRRRPISGPGNSIEYIVGTQTKATGAWTGVTKDPSLAVGKTIAYKLPYAGSGNASLTLTFTNPTGATTTSAIAIYTNTSRVTTQYKAGAVILLTYDGTYWRVSEYWNSNSRDPGYGKITPGAASTAAEAITANTTQIVAGTYNENLNINPGNKWVQVGATSGASNGGDTLTLGHALSDVTAGTSSPNAAQTPDFNSTFNIPTVTVDEAGHVTAMGTTTVKIPAQTNLSGGSATANDKTVVGGVTVSGHAVTVAKKTMTEGAGISITGATDKVTIGHSNSVTAGTAKGDDNKTLTFGGTFTIPTVTYDSQGHITGKGTTTMTMPANPNVDTKVKQTAKTDNVDYKILTTTSASPTSGSAAEAGYGANLAYNPSTNTLKTGNASLTGTLNVTGQTTFNQIPVSITPEATSNDTSVATTAFVKNAISGLSGAMHFRGTTTTAITDGSTTNPITISGSSYTAVAGDVVLREVTTGNIFEYIWTGSAWEMLGRDTSFKVTQTAVSSPAANGNTTAFIDTISQDTNGNITVTKKNLDTSGTWSGTATKATADGSGNNIIDTYLTKTVGVTDVSWTGNTDKKISKTINGVTSDIIQFEAGDNVALTATSNKLTIAAIEKIYPVHVTLTNATEGISDKSHSEILTAVNEQKIPFVYIDYAGSKIVASLLSANQNQANFVYNDQFSSSANYAFLNIVNKVVTLYWRGRYVASDELGSVAFDNIVPIEKGGTGNANGYIRTGQYSGSTIGADATIEGRDNTASGDTSHAEGVNATASGRISHAEGLVTTASGNMSHAEGFQTTASGEASHAEGIGANAFGAYSHAEGMTTIAKGISSHVFGEYNEEDVNNITRHSEEGYGNYVEIVGNGSADDARSNARTLDWNGNERLAGKLTVGVNPTNNMDVATKQYVDNYKPTAANLTTTQNAIAKYSDTTGSFANSGVTIDSNNNIVTSGTVTTNGLKGYVTIGQQSGVAMGEYATAEGEQGTNIASGESSHAEGSETTASGVFSHAEGLRTIAQRQSQHVFGEYNIADTMGTVATKGNYVEIVGNGTSNTRSNARTLDWNGNEVLAGKLTVGVNPTNDMDVVTKQYVDSHINNTIIYVTDFGATGDGVTNDSTSIQNAINSASNGGTIVFPIGTYKLETSLKFYSNQTLFFEEGATLLQGAEIDNLLRNYATLTDTLYSATENVKIIGGTFDGGNYSTNNTLLGFTHANNILIERCSFKNGYGTWHDIEVNSSKDVIIRNCYFDGSRRSGDNGGETIQLDSLSLRARYPWEDEGAVDSTPCENIIIEQCVFNNIKSRGIGQHSEITIYNLCIQNNKIHGDNGIRAIYLPYVNNFIASKNEIDNFTIGIYSYNSEKINITENTIMNCVTAVFLSSAKDGIINNNIFIGTNKETDQGVKLTPISNFIIINNIFKTYVCACNLNTDTDYNSLSIFTNNTLIDIASTFNYIYGTPLIVCENIINGAYYSYGTSLTEIDSTIKNYVDNASNLSSGTVAFDRLPSMYWANTAVASAASYNTTPEVASVKIGNGTATAAGTKGITLQYDDTLEVLNFVFFAGER